MILPKDGVYAMYLRKSRADVEAEARSQFETLAHHEQILTELADRYDIHISKTYKELASGDSIKDRPEVQKLLSEVSAGIYDGVLVTEISRLARGRTTDQGTVSETFLRSGTLIITPPKVYDPADEADETFFDFELFMARQEYKYIKKRMQRGRQLSRQNGNWIFPIIPTGYKKDGLSLVPNEDAETIRSALLGFANGNRNLSETALFLRASIPRMKFTLGTTRYMLTNPVYAGYHRPEQKMPTAESLNVNEYYPIKSEPLITLDDHIRIVHRIVPKPRLKTSYPLQNAFAGLLACRKCGRALVRTHNHGSPALVHKFGADNYPRCWCSGVSYRKAYNLVIEQIISDLPQVTYTPEDDNSIQQEIESLQKQLEKARKIKADLFQKLEDGLYTASEFKERKNIREQEIAALENQIDALKSKEKRPSIPISTDDLIEELRTGTPASVNELLKLLVSRIEYTRESAEDLPEFDIYYK